jgi:hypothetical protein
MAACGCCREDLLTASPLYRPLSVVGFLEMADAPEKVASARAGRCDRPLLTAPADGHRGRPTGILRGHQAGSLRGHAQSGLSDEEAMAPAQSDLSDEEAMAPEQSASRVGSHCHDRLTRS